MKKISIMLILFIMISLNVYSAEVVVENSEVLVNQNNIDIQSTEDVNEEMQFHSSGAVLLEMKTGKVLYDYNMNEKLYPASITKILTAILTIENCDLNDKAVASEFAVKSVTDGYATAGIVPGEEFTVEDLLEVMMLKSANEAATILAEHVSGSLEEFSKLMNKKAVEIGCKSSNFVNANGMHDENHYSTAYDMALIQKYCMQNKEYRRISSMTSCTLPNTYLYDKEIRTFKNTHGFLMNNDKNYYKYAISGKTGFTTPAKNCLVTSASKDGLELVAVVLHAEGKVDGISSRYYDTKQLFEYGFENYKATDFQIEETAETVAQIDEESVVDESSRIKVDEDNDEKIENKTLSKMLVVLIGSLVAILVGCVIIYLSIIIKEKRKMSK